MGVKNYDITKHTGFWTPEGGEEKKTYMQIGRVRVFCKGELPESLGVEVELPEHMIPIAGFENPLKCFERKPKV